ncbi:MAG TPA: hypothetical protein VJB18_09255 [Burkholderiales bacterium]|nr:hypothetical protein [Burkholderiales bacterium]
MEKAHKKRVDDLGSHARLLLDACKRFSETHNFDEIKNIGVRLRVLVGSGRGSGVLFELADESDDGFDVMVLNQYGVIRVTEIEHGTERVIQSVERKALITQIPGRLPIVFSERLAKPLYVRMPLREWIENGFLLDWEVPNNGKTPIMKRFTPRELINRYAGQEAAHSDSGYGTFGQDVESLTLEYVNGTTRTIVPVVYEYLYQIGNTVGAIALNYIESQQKVITNSGLKE